MTLASQLYFPQLHRRYVYGGDYIDELVTQFNVTGTTEKEYRVLQDLNWDVVALVDPTLITLPYEIAEQYAHEPYGVRFAIENGAGTPIPGFPASYVPLTDRSRNGLETDPVTKNIENRIRMLNTRTMRMNQGDPNATGLVHYGMSYHGISPTIMVNVDPQIMRPDGQNPYEYVGSNPIMRTDPDGLMFGDEDDFEREYAGDYESTMLMRRDWDDIYDSIVGSGSAFLGVQGAATWGAFWGGNVTALPEGAAAARGLSQGFSEFADQYAEDMIYLPVEAVFAGVGAFGEFAAAGQKTARVGRKARVLKHAFEEHHLLPQSQQFQKHFRRAGLNIENFKIKMPVGEHRLKDYNGIHTGKENWNRVWDDFFKANPSADRKKILAQLKAMVVEFGLDKYVSILQP